MFPAGPRPFAYTLTGPALALLRWLAALALAAGMLAG